DVPMTERAPWAVSRIQELISALTAVGAMHGNITRRAVGLDVEGRAVIVPPVPRMIVRRAHMGAGVLKGNLDDLSPEQLRGSAFSARSDVYQLGHLLFRLLGGPRPFPGERDLDVVQAIMSGVPARRLGAVGVAVPSPLEDVVAQAMALRPEERFASVKDLGVALASF